jgi:hypothetical protein
MKWLAMAGYGWEWLACSSRHALAGMQRLAMNGYGWDWLPVTDSGWQWLACLGVAGSGKQWILLVKTAC